MKLALCGAHGSGKTTLASKLAPRLSLFPLVHSVTTLSAIRMGYRRSSEVPSQRMGEFQWEALRQQIKLEDYYHAYVTHRSPVDYLAYFMYQVPEAHKKAADYAKVCYERLKIYNALIVLPVTTRGVDDGKRHLGDESVIDDWLRLIINRPDEFISEPVTLPPVIYVTTDGPDNRANEVLEGLHAVRESQCSGSDLF